MSYGPRRKGPDEDEGEGAGPDPPKNVSFVTCTHFLLSGFEPSLSFVLAVFLCSMGRGSPSRTAVFCAWMDTGQGWEEGKNAPKAADASASALPLPWHFGPLHAAGYT